MKKLSDKARMYARSYGQPPYGQEIEGTAELLLQMADKLEEYEDTGITPGQIREVDRLYAEKYKELAECQENCLTGVELANIAAGLKKLAEYEELEEQGKLLKLPCAVGDTVYTLNTLQGGDTVIGETTADAFFCALGMLEGRFGKTIFLTFGEAEAALGGLEGKQWT